MSEKKYTVPSTFTTDSGSTFTYDANTAWKSNTLDEIKQKWQESSQMNLGKSTAYRRRALGDSANANAVDQAGLWVHAQIDKDGIPKDYNTIEVNDEITQWRYTTEQEWRMIEKLPRTGIFFFLY